MASGSVVSNASLSKMSPEVRKKEAKNLLESSKRCEMPWSAFGKLNDEVVEGIPERKSLSTIGQQIPIKLNHYRVNFDTKGGRFQIHQYDVKVTQAASKDTDVGIRKMKEKAWNSAIVQETLGKTGRWLYDGNALAWSLEKVQGWSKSIDLGLEEGRGPSKPDSKNHVIFRIEHTRSLDAKNLQNMLDGVGTQAVIGWGEILNVLEHVLHQNPSQSMVVKNKSFYQKHENHLRHNLQDRGDLGQGITAVRGNYVSFKSVFMGAENNKLVRCLALNVDVSNSPFWAPGKVLDLLPRHLEGQLRDLTPAGLAKQAIDDMSSAQRQARGNDKLAQKLFYDTTRFGNVLGKLRRVKVNWIHLTSAKKDGKSLPAREFGIMDFKPKTPKEVFFTDDQGKSISVAQYFQQKYSIRTLDLPVAVFGAGVKVNYVPLECLSIVPDQKYNHKLDEKQTSNMLGFAVKPPVQRWEGIETAVKTMNWTNDPWIKDYNMSVQSNPIEVKNARLLPCPTINLDKASHPPKVAVTGRWRVDNKKFCSTNDKLPIGAFGFAISTTGRPIRRDEVKKFATEFVRIYAGHGGKFVNAHAAQDPFIWEGNLANPDQLMSFGKGIMQHCAKNSAGRSKPVLAFFIVNDRNALIYTSIKQACDLRWGTASQVLQARNVTKCQAQYISNVCLKVNAKLGGSTYIATGTTPAKQLLVSKPTAIIGADVTHGAPGVDVDSIAAITMSKDRHFTKYMGMVSANGRRQEIIQPGPIEEMITKMIAEWTIEQKAFPAQILYMRDGVSNQQFYKIVTEEVRDIKKALKKFLESKNKGTTALPKFTVLCATKRHHTRLFPTQPGTADQNRNPLPGTLVETGCTMATGVDWFLNSHVALKGTARPVHYVLLQNECGFSVEHLQQIVFEHCFQYVRSTTPVSQHPAIYYAHLAAARGCQHVGKTGSVAASNSSDHDTVIHPLEPLASALNPVMWYV